MQRRPTLEQVWRTAVTVVALAVTFMALYVQLFERRSRQQEDRLAAIRLETALAESRAELRAELLAELRAELARAVEAQPDGQPLPDTVLRRPESEGNGALQQAPQGSRTGRAGERIDALARQMAASDRALRRDLEELGAAVQHEVETSSRATSLLLGAVVLLVAHLLVSLWRPREARRGESVTPQP